MQLKRLKEKTMATTLTYGGEKLNFHYKPGALTEDWFDDVQEATKEEDMDTLKDAILSVVTEWDLMVDREEAIEAGVFGVYKKNEVGDWIDEDGGLIPQAISNLPDEIVVPVRREAVDALQIPLPLFGMINRTIQQDAQSGGKSTKKGR